MNGLELHPMSDCSSETESTSSAFTLLFLLVNLAAATYVFARYAESQNKLNYDSRFARIIGGALAMMTRMLHLSKEEMEINTEEGALITIGPHRTGLLDGLAVASRMKGAPPRFFATDAYNVIPGVAQFLKMFQAILIGSKAKKGADGRSANADAIEQASKALDEKGCVALFPQGNFSKIGGKIPKIYRGAAELAIQTNKPIHVIRLDGFWSLQNSLLPLFIRNNDYYRAILTCFI